MGFIQGIIRKNRKKGEETMQIYDYELAFGGHDQTSDAMRKAIDRWYRMYYGRALGPGEVPNQRIAYTVVQKLVKTVFGEYQAQAAGAFTRQVLQGLGRVSEEAMQQALVGGECYLKPWVGEGRVEFAVIPRCNVLVFGRDSKGMPVDMGMVEVLHRDGLRYSLLERRYRDSQGQTVLENRLFQSQNDRSLGQPVALSTLEEYRRLPARYVYPQGLEGLGLVRLKSPGINCVDGSREGVSIYGAAEELIRAIDENEAQLLGEFRRGESRILASSDLIKEGLLQDHLFVGLDEDPQTLGITVFSPQLREQSFLNRKQEYLRNVESLLGLKRGMLSNVNESQRTATEIASSAGDFNLTVMGLQRAWAQAVQQAISQCFRLAKHQGLAVQGGPEHNLDWGNGVLYDEDKTWADYVSMVDKGLLKPELALAWRFGEQAESPEQLQRIREKYMP